ncbi:MAG: amino acid--tRNA ligase-related protein [Pseudomonadales bacterium]|nr:elongation factor P lysine(34) lysyltransferase [Pseudomonadales bacterium]
MNIDWRPACPLAALEARARLMAELRAFFAERDVLEVQTSILAAHTVTEVAIESMAVGALGYLQTSPEYQMKRLLAAGAPSIYQITPVFRAGEAGRLHNPEFTLLEWYRLGFDDRALMKEVTALVERVLGPGRTEILAYGDLVGDLEQPRDDLDLAISEAIDALGEGRFFITRYPAEQAALARLHADDPSVAARFELVIDGVEVANGYWELTDAEEQRRRFAADVEQRRRRGLVEPAPDERLLASLDAGLPDCAGVALGVDRLLMLQQGASSLAEVMPFPIDRA